MMEYEYEISVSVCRLYIVTSHTNLILACVAGGFGGERARASKRRSREKNLIPLAASPPVFAASPFACERSPTKPPAMQANLIPEAFFFTDILINNTKK